MISSSVYAGIRRFVTLQPSPPRLVPAIRAAASMGSAMAAGWALGGVQTGLMTTLGAFTALYAADRPYRNRAVVLSAVAVGFALSVALGLSAQQVLWLSVPIVALIAMTATLLSNALNIGPPGAYMFTLTCAAATSIPTSLTPLHLGALVLMGGAIATAIHMFGALIAPRGPERAAQSRAAIAVARFARAGGRADAEPARHAAALALHDAWGAVVTRQSARPGSDRDLMNLRSTIRELHQLFAEVIRTSTGDEAHRLNIAARAEALSQGAAQPIGVGSSGVQGARLPLGHLGARDALRLALTPGASVRLAVLRVGLAVLLAGLAGALLGIDRAYWAMAAAVLVLHQNLDWTRTVRRAADRVVGTVLGLLLAGLVLSLHPEGAPLVATVVVLQFMIELLVVRNYALAVVFITAVALTIASGGLPVTDPGALLFARGIDTVIGCFIGLGVHFATVPRDTKRSLSGNIARTLDAMSPVLSVLSEGEVISTQARRGRRDLQYVLMRLVETAQSALGGVGSERAAAEALWPAVTATQRLGYRLLAACWAREGGDLTAGPRTRVAAEKIESALASLARTFRGESPTASPADMPDFLGEEIAELRRAILTNKMEKRG